MRPLELRDAQIPLRQLRADLIDLRHDVAVLEARERLAVLPRLEVDVRIAELVVLASRLELRQHQVDFGHRQGLDVGELAQSQARAGFLVAASEGFAA